MGSLIQHYRALSPEEKLRLRRILTVIWLSLIAGLAIWVVQNQRQDLNNVWHQLKDADHQWLLIATVAELCGITSVAWTQWLILKRLGHRLPLSFLTSVHVQRTGVDFAAPFGGPITAYVFVDRLSRFRVPAQDAVLTLGVRTLCVWGATLVVLVIAAALTGQALAIVGSVVAVVVAVVAVIWLGRLGSGDWRALQRWAGKLPERIAERVIDGIQRLKAHHLIPRDLLAWVGTTLITRTATLTLIYACVRALGETPSVYTVFVAYIASFIAARLVPVLYGMGAIEGSLSLALAGGGIPLEVAVGAALLFRFFDFFAPALIGLLIYLWEERRFRSLRSSSIGGN
jgi:uncharacterized membrane protein YbhN (UPF0104 family)